MILRLLAILLTAATLAAAEPAATGGAVKVGPNPSAAAFFEARIRPMLVQHCAECHAGGKRYGGLRTDSLEAMLEGGHDEGPAVIPGDVQRSPLLRSLRYEGDSDLNMPPKAKLPAEVIRDFEHWVAIGAPWPTGEPVVAPAPPARTPLLGRLHPLVVHLPIGALLVAALAEALVLLRGRRWSPAVAVAAALAAAGAVGAVVSGINAEGGQAPALIEAHEQMAWAATALMAAVAALAWWRERRDGSRLPLRILLLLALVAVSVAGHRGGALVYGPGWPF
ncbi:MAG: hypothetical protein L6R48_06655 [Planctomycetes bacterium]|nr:hypothetical protein [Planctomycetota bacterium]